MKPSQKPLLLKKQYLVTSDNIKKLKSLAKSHDTSDSDILRKAIDAYSYQENSSLLEDQDLIKLVSERLKQTIKDTRATRNHLNKTLKALKR